MVAQASTSAPTADEPAVAALIALRSGTTTRVRNALRNLDDPEAIHIAQIVQLLAWDDVLDAARTTLERHADRHVGLLIDALLDHNTDFAIRRRIPRILGTLRSRRALDGVVCGLDDPRFEVRYQAGRAIDRMIRREPTLSVERDRILQVVERELSVEPTVWRAYRLLDRADAEEDETTHARTDRSLEHAFLLLATVLPREEMLVALQGVDSSDVVLRGLALEYLESVLPHSIRTKLWAILDARIEDAQRVTPQVAIDQLRKSQQMAVLPRPTPSAADAPGQSDPQSKARRR
jgi:hypothetical protein